MEQPSSTLFVADLPIGIDEAEFNALFRNTEGFIDTRLRKDKNSNIVGFAEYEEPASAARAKDRLNGYKFSPISDRGISIHFARTGSSGVNGNGSSGVISSNNSNGSNSVGRVSKRQEDLAKPYGSGSAGAAGGAGGGGPGAAGAAAGAAGYGGYYGAMLGMNAMSGMNAMTGMGLSLPVTVPSSPLSLLPDAASSTLYVEGLPTDASEREVAHIFRPYQGFQSVRISLKESKQYPNRNYVLCFVEFDNKYQATLAMHALQGYRMDKNDSKGLHISYAKSERRDTRNPRPVPGVAPTTK